MDVKSLSRIGVKLRHEATILSKLACIEPLDSFSVDQITFRVLQEALHSDLSLMLIQELTGFESLFKTARIILVAEAESPLEFKWVEVEFLKAVGSW